MSDIKIIDNFYDDPDIVKSLATVGFNVKGCGNTKRSIELKDIDQTLYDNFCNRIYEMHNISDIPNLHTFTFFQEQTYEDVEMFNTGYIHIDGRNPNQPNILANDYPYIVCGQIFLTPEPDPLSKISIAQPKHNWTDQELFDRCLNNYLNPRFEYNAGKLSLSELEQYHSSYHADLEIIEEIPNVYNRLVSWPAGTLHGEQLTKKMGTRLNQYFYVKQSF